MFRSSPQRAPLERAGENDPTGNGGIAKHTYLHRAFTDHIFVILSPLLAFALVAWFCTPRFEGQSLIYNPEAPGWLFLFAAHMTFAHLVFVFYRSHLNPAIFSAYPRRFVLGPLLIFVALIANEYVFLIAAAVAVQWDELHSVMQTFGLGRLYDRQAGKIRSGDRPWDMAFCFAFQLFPYTAMLTYLTSDGVLAVLEIEDAEIYFPGEFLVGLRYVLFGFIALVGVGYTLRLVFSIIRGSPPSRNKILLFTATACSTLFVVSSYTFFEASIVGNLYHAAQYFFVVLVFEKSSLSRLFSWIRSRAGFYLVGAAMLAIAFFSAHIRILTENFPLFMQFWLMISLVHFWFDGFIWSIRRGQV